MSETRLHHFKVIANRYPSQSDLSKLLDYSPGYINQLLTGRRNIGEKVARAIEQKLGLPNCTLDKPINAVVNETQQYIVTKQEKKLSPSETRLINEMKALLKEDMEPMDLVMLQQIISKLLTKYNLD